MIPMALFNRFRRSDSNADLREGGSRARLIGPQSKLALTAQIGRAVRGGTRAVQ
jgi:hypothetical protein